jgi:hypothetical protein
LTTKGHRSRKYPSCGLVFDPNKLLLTSYVISIFTPNLSNVKLNLPVYPIGIQDLNECVNMAEMRWAAFDCLNRFGLKKKARFIGVRISNLEEEGTTI